MPELLAPVVRVRASFVEALEEYHAEGRYRDLDPVALAPEDAFREHVEYLRVLATTSARLPPGWVPTTVLWWIDGDQYLGRVSIRHGLTESLRRVGGHIGYEVRPGARRRGHGTRMLGAALPVARSLGIDPALVTCLATNVASRRIIESAGGRFQDELEGELRFWVPTGPDR